MIFLVEDDSNDTFFLEDALRRVGVKASLEIAQDGQEAIDRLTLMRESPDIILLDLNLPRRSGLEVLKWLRQESPWRTAIVIVLTSSTSHSDQHQAYLLGANSYVVKPADATKLRDLMQHVDTYWLGWNEKPPPPRTFRGSVTREPESPLYPHTLPPGRSPKTNPSPRAE